MITSRITLLGFAAVEMVIGISIAALVLLFSTYTITQSISISSDISEKTQALYLAEEGLELMRYIRDNDWADISGLTVGNTYYLDVTPTSVGTSVTPETIGDFSRSVVLANVYRHASTDDVLASTTPGSVADTSSKYVTVTVSWGSPAESVALTSVLSDITP